MIHESTAPLWRVVAKTCSSRLGLCAIALPVELSSRVQSKPRINCRKFVVMVVLVVTHCPTHETCPLSGQKHPLLFCGLFYQLVRLGHLLLPSWSQCVSYILQFCFLPTRRQNVFHFFNTHTYTHTYAQAHAHRRTRTTQELPCTAKTLPEVAVRLARFFCKLLSAIPSSSLRRRVLLLCFPSRLQMLLPRLKEFSPDLLIISAGAILAFRAALHG